MEDQQMHRLPTPAFAQAVRQVLGIDDLIPGPGVVIPALRDPVTGPRIEAVPPLAFRKTSVRGSAS
jgi:hypothetical protein